MVSVPVDQYVGVGEQVAGVVEGRAAFSGVEVFEQPGPIGIGTAAGKGTPPSQRITFWPFDFRNISAEVGEQLAAVGTRDLVGDLDDPDSFQSACHAGSPMAFGSMY
jgi:hypothetical protein